MLNKSYHLTLFLFTKEPCQRLTTKEECEILARKLHINDTTAIEVKRLDRPPYCYYKPNNKKADKRLFFNTAVTDNATPCTDKRNCVCKDGIQTSGNMKHKPIFINFLWELCVPICLFAHCRQSCILLRAT